MAILLQFDPNRPRAQRDRTDSPASAGQTVPLGSLFDKLQILAHTNPRAVCLLEQMADRTLRRQAEGGTR